MRDGGGNLTHLCDRCDRLSTGQCERCATPFCPAHLPDPGRRCPDCEARYARSRGVRGVAEVAGLGAAVAAVSLVATLLLPAGTFGAGLWFAATLAAARTARLAYQRMASRARRRFLSESVRRDLPAARVLGPLPAPVPRDDEPTR
jgi:type IV secretory pathway TrbD component